MKQNRIFLVDDMPVYRNAMKTLLKKSGDVQIVGEASNGQEFIDMIDNHPADIVFMDIEMPIMNGIEATRQVKEKNPDMLIIGLSLYENNKYVEELIAAGAQGYLLKLSDNAQIIKTILENPRSQIFYSREIVHNPEEKDMESKNVLINISDDQTGALIAKSLEEIGYQCKINNNGLAEAKFVVEGQHDLLIVDMDEDQEQKLQRIKSIREEEADNHIAIIGLANKQPDDVKKEARQAGITGWIEKPIVVNSLIKISKKAMK
jgi:DNA-binding NarL/FixJ family response regulator